MSIRQKFDLPPLVASPAGGVLVPVVGTPADGDVVTWVAANSRYEPVAGGGGGALDGLTDVDASAPNDGDVLTYDSASGNWIAAPPGDVSVPYMYPFGQAIDDPINDNFAGAALDTAGTRFSGAAAWSHINQGGGTVALRGRRLWYTCPAEGTLRLRGVAVALPSGAWCIRAPMAMRPGYTVTGQRHAGLFLRDSVGGKCESYGIGYSGGGVVLWMNKWTNTSTHNSVRDVDTFSIPQHVGPFFEIEYDLTNYYFRYGLSDGTMYVQSGGFAATSFLDNPADQIGFMATNDSSIATTLIAGGLYRVETSHVVAG
jgi:hypothetical protein